MNALLDRSFLQDIGVSMSDEEFATFSDHYEKTLQDRITSSIIEELDNVQLEQLHQYKQKSDAELQLWLKENVPELKSIIEDEAAILVGEIAENSNLL